MLDKENNYNIDEQFTQDAWLQMEQMLNKEMPVEEKKKRRGAFWIWLTGLAVVVLGIGVYSIYFTDVEEPARTETAIAIAEKDNSKNKEKEIKPLENTIPNSTTKTSTLNSNNKEILNTNSTTSKTINEKSEVAVAKNNTTTTNASTQPAYPTGRQDNPLNNLPQIPNVSESEISPPISTSQEQGAKASILYDIPSSSEKETTKKTKAPIEEPIVSIAKPLNINTLSMLSLNEIMTKKRAPSLRLPIKVKSSSWLKSNVNWGLEVGTQTANLKNLNGFFAGARLDFNLNPRWFISSGIRYNYNRYETDQLNLGEKDDLFATPDANTDTTSISTSDPTPVSNVANEQINNVLKTQANFHVLSLPFTLNYRLHSKWSIGAGGNVSYLLAARPSISPGSITSRGTAYLDADAFNSNFVTAVSESVTRRWDFAIRGGVRFEINNRMGAGLNYHAVLRKNKGTNKKESLQNSVLQLSLNYKF